ncbi:hypothetical protein NPIL_193691, partial [Nephila pilipes]
AKLNQCQNECSSLRDEVQELQLVRDDLQQYVRKLEQKNDDFERATRNILFAPTVTALRPEPTFPFSICPGCIGLYSAESLSHLAGHWHG